MQDARGCCWWLGLSESGVGRIRLQAAIRRFGILHYILKGSEKRMQQDVVGRISVAPSDIADFSSLSGIKNPNRSLVDFLSDAARGLIRPTVLC